MVCCKQGRYHEALEKAREVLEKEIDLIRLIRSRRYIHLGLKHLLDAPLRKELKEKSKYKDVDNC